MALPSGQMGSLKHLGLDGAVSTKASDTRVRRSTQQPVPGFAGEKNAMAAAAVA